MIPSKQFELFDGGQNRRLLAALSYFQRAVRLDVAGNSPWEFMPEMLLNYAKCLDVLFVCTKNLKDDVRGALKQLKYDDDTIEGDFIPLMILRSFVDVAHPRIKMDELAHRNVLFNYLSHAEQNIRDLLTRVMVAVQDCSYKLPPQPDINLSKDDKKGMDRLIKTMSSRFTLPESDA